MAAALTGHSDMQLVSGKGEESDAETCRGAVLPQPIFGLTDLDAAPSYPEPYDLGAMSPEQSLHHVRQVVEVLASSAEQQACWLGTNRFPPHELMLHLADALDVIVPGRVNDGDLTALARDEMRTLLHLLDDIEENYRMWSIPALFVAREWDAVRVHARRTLGQLPAGALRRGA
jgi:hypothetical protein